MTNHTKARWQRTKGQICLRKQDAVLLTFDGMKFDARTQAMLIGETGSGKSTFGKYICGFDDSYFYPKLDGQTGLNNDRAMPWSAVYIRQDPFKSFHPYISIGSHFKDLLKMTAEKRINSLEEVVDLLIKLKIDDPRALMRRRVNQISQGEAQRCAMVMALIKKSDFIVADEITAHVDQLTGNILLQVLKEFSDDNGFGYLVISHKPSQTQAYCKEYYRIKDKVLQAYSPMTDVDGLRAVDRINTRHDDEGGIEVVDWMIDFDQRSYGRFNSGLKIESIIIPVNKIWGLKGGSGSGKTSLVQAIMAERESRFKTLSYNGKRLDAWRELSEIMQIRYLPQSVVSVFNPRQSIAISLKEIAKSHKVEEEIIFDYLGDLALEVSLLDHRPHELSGGQIQRFGLLSLLLSKPDLLILDESFSAMDSNIRQRVWGFLKNKVGSLGIGMILISHDPVWLEEVSDLVYDIDYESVRF